MTQNAPTDPAEYARIAVDTASDRLASDIVMLDIRGLSDFADYFIILTGESTRQLRDVSEAIEATLEAAGAALHHREGAPRLRLDAPRLRRSHRPPVRPG